MKKIMFVIGCLGNGGAERVVSILANSFAKENEVHVVTLFSDEIDYKLNDNIKYSFLMKDDKNNGVKRNISRIFKLRSYIKNVNPDCVISFLAVINIITILSMVGLKKKLVLSERNDPKHEPGSKMLRLIRDVLYRSRKNNYFVFQTKYAQSCFGNKIKNRSKIIYNPVKSDLPSRDGKNIEKRVVCISRLTDDKNIPLLLKAFKIFLESKPDYNLEIYGRGELLDSLIQEAVSLGINSNVKFMGFSKEVHKKISNAKMFVLSSNYEGISNAMIEAIAMGMPVVCTDCPAYGAREFIVNNQNGLLVPVNDVKSFSNAMLTIADNIDYEDTAMKRAGVVKLDLSVGKITEQWEEFVEEVI